RAKSACAASVQPTCSPSPRRPAPVSVTIDVGRGPPYDGTGIAPLAHATPSMTTGRSASAAASRSAVGGTAETREDLPALREVPVAERVPRDERLRRPRAAAQHLVPAPEVDRRVLGIGERLEARVRLEVARGPFPHAAEHLLAAVVARALRKRAGRRGREAALIEVRPLGRDRPVAPGMAARHESLEVPRGRLLPLGLRREALAG